MNALSVLKTSMAMSDMYENRDTKKFVRPQDHCYEVKELSDKDGDCLLSIRKTDADHMLGYNFNNMFYLWKFNHQVNQWFHQIREQAKNWLHPYYDATYGNKNTVNPPYFDSLPPTLTPGSKKMTKPTMDEFLASLESLPTKDRRAINAMAKALEISTMTLYNRAKTVLVNLNNHATKPTKDEFMAPLDAEKF